MTTHNKNFLTIREKLNEQDLLIQFAEECAEAAQAALKMSRAVAGNNPARKKANECYENLIEELSDVCLSAAVLGIRPDEEIIDAKINRWAGILGGTNEEAEGT